MHVRSFITNETNNFELLYSFIPLSEISPFLDRNLQPHLSEHFQTSHHPPLQRENETMIYALD